VRRRRTSILLPTWIYACVLFAAVPRSSETSLFLLREVVDLWSHLIARTGYRRNRRNTSKKLTKTMDLLGFSVDTCPGIDTDTRPEAELEDATSPHISLVTEGSYVCVSECLACFLWRFLVRARFYLVDTPAILSRFPAYSIHPCA